jgi:hypothetical protein
MPQGRLQLRVLVFVGASVSLHAACKSSPPQAGGDAAPAVAVDAATADAAPLAESTGGDAVRPVYPEDVKPEPIAVKLCEALHANPEKARAACCSEQPAFTPTSECIRVVSGALQLKAVTLDVAAVDRCVADLEKAYAGCDWVGSHKIVPPESCDLVFRGTLPEGKRCRSSLECLDGLHCAGVGPTDAGRCKAPADDNSACGVAVDVLERYTRQQNPERKHAACRGICDRQRCVAQPPVGAPCKASISCGPDRACVADKCAPARHQKVGEACADGECDKGLYCIKGKCVGPQPAGAECSTEFECIGACLVSDGGTKGKCGRRCAIR